MLFYAITCSIKSRKKSLVLHKLKFFNKFAPYI